MTVRTHVEQAVISKSRGKGRSQKNLARMTPRSLVSWLKNRNKMNLFCLSHTDLRSVVTRASTDAHILLPKAQSFALKRQKIIST